MAISKNLVKQYEREHGDLIRIGYMYVASSPDGVRLLLKSHSTGIEDYVIIEIPDNQLKEENDEPK